jgi:hypothetical protein
MSSPWAIQQLLVSRTRDDVTVPGLTPRANWGAVVEGAVDLLAWAANRYRLQNALKKLEPNIQKIMPKDGGVLVLIVYCAAMSKLFQSAYVVRAGYDATQTYSSYQELISRTGTVSTACPEGWVRSEEYLWITK